MSTRLVVVSEGTPAIHGGRPIFPERFRFIRPTLPPLDAVLASYRPVYENGVITNADLVSRFEQAAAERLQVDQCVAVSSCTSGLCLVLRALGLTGEVIVPSFTFLTFAPIFSTSPATSQPRMWGRGISIPGIPWRVQMSR